MSTSPRSPVSDPLVTRRYDPSRIHKESIVSAYDRLLPIISRRLGPPQSHSGESGRAETQVGKPKSSVVGA
jgi:hypothetical protein